MFFICYNFNIIVLGDGNIKKISLVSIISLLFLVLSSVVAYYLKFKDLKNWTSLLIGVLIALFSGVLALTFKKIKITKYISLFLNAIALGFCIRAWYIYRSYDNTLLLMIAVSLLSLCYLWMFYLFLYLPFIEKYINVFFILYVILSLIGYVLLIIFTKTTWLSTFGYYMIVEISFIIGLCMTTDSIDELVKIMLLCSFSVFIVALIIAILMLGGDGIDFDFDLGIGGGNRSSPKKKKVKRS